MSKVEQSQPTEIYLVRHAASQPDAGIPEPLWPLSAKGRAQAQELASFLKEIAPHHLYSSPYPRAVDTLRPVAEQLNLEIRLDFALRERKLTEGFRPDWLELLRRSWADFDFALEGCESSRAAQTRVVETILRIANNHSGRRIVVASHGNAIGLALHHGKPTFGFEQWQRLRNPDVRKLKVVGATIEWIEKFEYAGVVTSTGG